MESIFNILVPQIHHTVLYKEVPPIKPLNIKTSPILRPLMSGRKEQVSV